MKRIALMNDLSGFGKCSLTAAIPVVSVMGIQACPLPTAVLSAQTEFGDVYCDDDTDRMRAITEYWSRMDVTFDGIHSGYLASPLQIGVVQQFLDRFQQEDTIYLADPVMGDQGQYYSMVNDTYLQGMRQLTRRADVITPNLTELCFLAEVDYASLTDCRGDEQYVEQIQECCKRLLQQAQRPQTIIVTGIVTEHGNARYIGNLAVAEDGSYYAQTPYMGESFSGTGDLFAAVICGAMVKGMPARTAVDLAMDFLQEAIQDAARDRIPPNHGVEFERYLYRLIDPTNARSDRPASDHQQPAHMQGQLCMTNAAKAYMMIEEERL